MKILNPHRYIGALPELRYGENGRPITPIVDLVAGVEGEPCAAVIEYGNASYIVNRSSLVPVRQ